MCEPDFVALGGHSNRHNVGLCCSRSDKCGRAATPDRPNIKAWPPARNRRTAVSHQASLGGYGRIHAYTAGPAITVHESPAISTTIKTAALAMSFA
jgi:hypothetical protein